MATATNIPLASVTLSSAASAVTFGSISQSYTDLRLVVNAKSTSSGSNVVIIANGDNATNYSTTYLYGDGTSAGSGRLSNRYYGLYGPSITTTQFVPMVFNIMSYSNATTYKTALCKGGAVNDAASIWVDLWRSTAAITSLYIWPAGFTFEVGSTFNLYGIL